jgi:hypothetical protein
VKKAALLLLLALLLVSMMSTGSLAIYTKTRELRGSLSTRALILQADEKPVSYELGLDGLALAPGETRELYRFDLTNAASAANVSDYAMMVSIRSQGMAQAIQAMEGLSFALYDMAKEGAPIATVSAGELLLEGIAFQPGVRKNLQYRLTAHWRDTGDSAGQTALAETGQAFSVRLVVTAQAQH